MESPTQGTQVPYPPSWVDRLVTWIGRLPGPAWLSYALGWLIAALLVHAGLWIAGGLPLGSVDPLYAVDGLLIIYWLALYHYLTRSTSRALQVFRPLLDVDDSSIGTIRYELTMLPRWLGWLAIPLGLGTSLIAILGNPTPYGKGIQPTPLLYALDVVSTGFLVSTFCALLIRTIRQLRMVSKLHARATRINVLRLAPAHAFSVLTAHTGLGIILLMILGAVLETLEFGAPQGVAAYAAFALLSIAVFILPVVGIRNRIEEAKGRARGDCRASADRQRPLAQHSQQQ